MRDKERLARAFGKLNMQVKDGLEMGYVANSGVVSSGLKAQSAVPSKHAVVLLCGSDISLTTAFEGLRALAAENWCFTAVLSKSAEALISEEQIQKGFSPKQLLKESEGVSVKRVIDMMDALIIPNLTQNTLAKVSVGIQDELTSLITWQALVTNKPVAINTDSIFKGWFDIDMNRGMKRTMQSHVAVLKGYGAKLADQHDYLATLCGSKKRVEIGTKSDTKPRAQKPIQTKVQQRKPSAPQMTPSEIAEKRLLTERDIKAMEGVTELTIGKGQILTPLGRDAAISKGIRIIYQRR
jgi:ethanolamine utilization protein